MPSTAEGLAALAGETGADVIAFGSSYRTPPGSVPVTEEEADLLVVTSRAGAPDGQLLLSGVARERVEQARAPVLMLARGAALSFG